MSLSQKLIRTGYVEDRILEFITVKTWCVEGRKYITEVQVNNGPQYRRVTKGVTRAEKQHYEAIGEVARLYGGVWAPVKYQEGSESCT